MYIHVVVCCCCKHDIECSYLYICSAGIGRTGVFILMETALWKLEVLEPIYPLDLVRIMRDQRGMLVQTPVSVYVFGNPLL